MNNEKILVQKKKKDWASRADCEFYEDGMGLYARTKDLQVVQSYLKSCKGLALDLPCGAGRWTEFLIKKGFIVVSADYNELMLRTTRKRTGNASLRCDAFHLPFKKESFDAILTMRLVFHYPRPRDLFSELTASLKDNGIFVFDTLNKYSLRYWIQFPLDLYRRDVGQKLYFVTKRNIRKMLSDLNLEFVAVESHFLLPGRAYQHLPNLVVSALGFLERILPRWLRGVSYWKVRKSSHP
jgi:SAM-dependent methyltransferase